ncbi:MAG TPA: rhomboid family intramembrane serine protease [Solirubrobacteraceae bacterium]|nr:rhomboid family intramembrane serine protease [Solirubrobacteraceae bacterium]
MFPLKDNIPTEHFPVVTLALIAINVVVFLFWQEPSGFSGVDQAKVVEYGAIPYELTHPGQHCAIAGTALACGDLRTDDAPTLLTLLTSMFMHGGFLHLGGNMLFLWIFGNNVEDAMGPLKFIVFYVVGGVAALAGQVAFDPDAAVPTIGASGAVAAVLGGYLLLHPRARVLTLVFIIFFVTIIEIPAILMLGLWFLQQAFFAARDLSDPLGGGGGVAYWAHIGGFVFGVAAIKAFARRRRQDPATRRAAL